MSSNKVLFHILSYFQPSYQLCLSNRPFKASFQPGAESGQRFSMEQSLLPLQLLWLPRQCLLLIMIFFIFYLFSLFMNCLTGNVFLNDFVLEKRAGNSGLDYINSPKFAICVLLEVFPKYQIIIIYWWKVFNCDQKFLTIIII